MCTSIAQCVCPPHPGVTIHHGHLEHFQPVPFVWAQWATGRKVHAVPDDGLRQRQLCSRWTKGRVRRLPWPEYQDEGVNPFPASPAPTKGAALIFHEATLWVAASPDQVARFITTPDRVQAYFPDALEGGVLVEDEAIWIRAKTGTTMIERISGDGDAVTVRVTSTAQKVASASREELAAKPLLRFYEDWHLEAHNGGTRITKHWRDLEAFGVMRWLPARWLVRRAAHQGTAKLVAAWSEA